MKRLRDQSGAAMLLVLMTMTILGMLAGDMVYQYQVYNNVVYNQLDSLKAEQLAKSGLRLARLQVHAANQIAEAIEKLSLPVSPDIADQLWQTPMVLPPPIPPGANTVTKEVLQKFQEELGLPGQISISITGESHKLNLNSLVWKNPEPKKDDKDNRDQNPDQNPNPNPNPSAGNQPQNQGNGNPEQEKPDPLEVQRKILIQAIDQMIANEMENNDEFAEYARDLTGEVIVKNILAWIDRETESLGSGEDKRSYYSQLNPEISIKNAPMFSISELNFVKDFNSQMIRLFEDNFTTIVTEGINVNQINVTMLRALIPDMSQEQAEELIKRRDDPVEGGKFKKVDDFYRLVDLIGSFGDVKQTMQDRGIALVTRESAFRVTVQASVNDATQNWLAVLGPAAPVIVEPKKENKPGDQDKDKSPVKGGEQIDNDEAVDSGKKDEKKDEKPPIDVPEVVYLKVI